MTRIGLAWWTLLLLALWATYSHAQQCTQAQLNQEFVGDITARGYSACASDGVVTGPNNDDTCTLQKFNQPCQDPLCKVDQVITKEHLYEVIDPAEYTAMLKDTTKAERKAAMDEAFTINTFNMSIAAVRQKLLDIFPAPSSPLTNQAIKDLQKKNAARSEIVCGRPGNLDDISCGLRNTGCP